MSTESQGKDAPSSSLAPGAPTGSSGVFWFALVLGLAAIAALATASVTKWNADHVSATPQVAVSAQVSLQRDMLAAIKNLPWVKSTGMDTSNFGVACPSTIPTQNGETFTCLISFPGLQNMSGNVRVNGGSGSFVWELDMPQFSGVLVQGSTSL
jgi:hypothetical protein